MMYLRIINNQIVYPYSFNKLKEDNPHTSFPLELSEAILIDFDIFEVRQTPKPNDYTKNIFEGIPLLVDGIYYQNWEMEDATSEEINQRIEVKWEEVRQIRNELLQECDWTQLGDIPTNTKEMWQNYRQQLRDVTTQSNPFNITWPEKP